MFVSDGSDVVFWVCEFELVVEINVYYSNSLYLFGVLFFVSICVIGDFVDFVDIGVLLVVVFV